MIPAAFDYLRAHSTDEAFAFMQQHGAEARVLAGGQSLIPAMRFRLARPGVLVDINSVADLNYLRIEGQVLVAGAIARDSDVERAPWITDRRWSLFTMSRVSPPTLSCARWARCRQLVSQRPGRRLDDDGAGVAGGSRGPREQGARTVKIDDFLVDSFATAVNEGEMAIAVRFPVPDDRTAGSYQKVERKVGDFATAAAAVQISLNENGTIRQAGVALSAAGPCAVRVAEAERQLTGQKPTADLIRSAAAAASTLSAPQADLRGSVEYKKHLAGVLVARGLRQALSRLGVQA